MTTLKHDSGVDMTPSTKPRSITTRQIVRRILWTSLIVVSAIAGLFATSLINAVNQDNAGTKSVFNDPSSNAPLTGNAAPVAPKATELPAVSVPENLSDRLAIVKELPTTDFIYEGKPVALTNDEGFKTLIAAYTDVFNMAKKADYWQGTFRGDPRYLWGVYEKPVTATSPPPSLALWASTGNAIFLSSLAPTDPTHLDVQVTLYSALAGQEAPHGFDFKLVLIDGVWLIHGENQTS